VSKGAKIFHAVAQTPDPELAVAALSPKRWLKLYAHLLRNYDENLLSGRILGLMLVDGARRYAAAQAKRNKARKVLG
jgi:hypothetical protein